MTSCGPIVQMIKHAMTSLLYQYHRHDMSSQIFLKIEHLAWESHLKMEGDKLQTEAHLT